MSAETTAERLPKKDTRAANLASQRTFARRRAEKAQTELKSQGYIVIRPDSDDEPLPDDPALVDAWGRGYHAGWRQGYRDGIAG